MNIDKKLEEVVQTHFNVSQTNKLAIMEQYHSVQGEGYHCGRSAYFIRLAGCDVGCSWCDTKSSWNAKDYPILTINTIVENVLKSKCSFVVITGGEPTLYDLTYLTTALKTHNIEIAIETAGTNTLKAELDWITFSPKKFKSALDDYYNISDELKIIITNKNDFIWAEKYASKMNVNCKLYLQAEWSKNERINPEIIKYIKDNPKWRISLQSHKYLNIN